MSASLRALLAEVIDYAGLFPPAQLPLDQAIRNYARYRQEPEAWMLGRFICPAARLGELDPFVEELFRTGPPLALSALGRSGGYSEARMLQLLTTGGTDLSALGPALGRREGYSEDWQPDLKADLEALTAFQARHGQRVQADFLEVRSPPDLSDPDCLAQTYFQIFFTAVSGDSPIQALYFEAPPGPAWRESTTALIGLLTAQKQTFPSIPRLGPPGFKLRCGGLEASAFPSPEQVAFFITACRDAGVPLKFTAGLHHPIRHYDAGVRTKMHGFLNVFVAGVLARARWLSEKQVRLIIEDGDASHFVFDDAGLRWKGLRATTDEIVTARREPVTSFGSCSFDEPRDDLRALGLLP